VTERNLRISVSRDQFQDALFSLVAGLHLTQIQQIRFFSDWLLCRPFLFFDWLISGSSQQNLKGALDSSTVRAARLMFARCGTLKHEIAESFFQREKYNVWRECVT